MLVDDRFLQAVLIKRQLGATCSIVFNSNGIEVAIQLARESQAAKYSAIFIALVQTKQFRRQHTTTLICNLTRVAYTRVLFRCYATSCNARSTEIVKFYDSIITSRTAC